MKKLHKLTLLSFLGPFVVTFFVCLFVLLMQFLFKYVEDLVGKGLEWYIVLELLVYAAAHLVPLALPLAVLLSALMTFGNLAENSELTAMKASGISLGKVMRPLILTVFVLSCGAFYFANTIIPHANLKFRALMWDVRQQKPAFDIQEGIFYNHLEGYNIRVSEKPEPHLLKDIIIYDHTDGRGNVNVLRASEGKMEVTRDERWLVLSLFDGVRYEEMEEQRSDSPPTFPHNRVFFDEYEIVFDLSDFQMERTDESLFSHHYEMLNIHQLSAYVDSMNNELDKKAENVRSYGRRYISILERPLPNDLSGSSPERSPEQTFDEWLANADIPAEVYRNALDQGRGMSNISERNAKDVKELNSRKIRYELEWHRRFTLSVACLMLFLIGAPLGAIVGKGGLGMPTVLAVVLFIFFHILSTSYEKFAREAVISPMMGMWIPIFVIFPMGLLLAWQANNDSAIFHRELYFDLLRKIGLRKKSGKKP